VLVHGARHVHQAEHDGPRHGLRLGLETPVADIDRIDAELGRFQGRIRRDDWREQARLLSAGDTAGYAAKFGNL